MKKLTFAIAGKSQIKFDALDRAVWHLDIHATVVKVPNAPSEVNEQPVGFDEIWRGASNRALNAHKNQPGYDAYFGIENGIQEISSGRWVDYAIIHAYMPSESAYKWVSSGGQDNPAAALDIPTIAVEKTRAKQGGFELNTVGKTLVEMGLVEKHDDPHVALCGEPRSLILKRACIELIRSLPEKYKRTNVSGLAE
jgi:non-canonical (house-cleaning) NTP pyrophosphatase